MQDILTDLDYTPALASRGKRWVACFIDYLICFALIIFTSYVFGVHSIDEDGNKSWELNGLPGFFAVMLPWMLRFPAIESFNGGQTIGKAIFRIKIVKEDGSKINFVSSFIKHLFDMVDYFPFLGIVGLMVSSNSKNKQRVGDLVAKTIVVDSRS